MTSNRNSHITLMQPGELLASVPHLLGFHPTDSLVVIGLHGSPETTISVVLRSDLPPPSGVRALAEYLLVPLAQHNSTSAVMIVIGGVAKAPDGDLPHQDLLARCESVLADGGFPVVHQLWTPETAAGRRWHCYDEFGCTGIMPDPTSTELAAAASDAGMVIYDRREDIVATLRPEPDEILARRSASLDQLTDEPDPGGTTQARLNLVQSAITAAETTQPTLSDNDVIQLSRALADHRVRDTCLDFDELPDVAAAERLWTALARATPAPERAEPACLLAFSAYARGDGVLAGIALTEAETADPGHRLASLLRSALALGLPPRKIRTAGIRAATFARQALTEDQPPTAEPTPTISTTTEPSEPPAAKPEPTSTDATHAVPTQVKSPPEPIVAAVPTELATAPSHESLSIAPTQPDSPAAATIPAAEPPTVPATPSMSVCVPATSEPALAEPSAMDATTPAGAASSVPDSVPTVDIAAPAAPDPTPAEAPTPANEPTAEPTTTDAPTPEPTDVPAPATLPNDERPSSDIPTEAHQEAS